MQRSIVHQIVAIPRDDKRGAHQPKSHHARHPGRLVAATEECKNASLREQDAGTAEPGDEQGDGQTCRAEDEARAIGTDAGTKDV